MQMATFGERLRAARERAGYTQEQLGLELGVGKAAVSAWENDNAEPQITRLLPLRRLLKISIDDLVCGPEREYPQMVIDRPGHWVRELDYVIPSAGRNVAANAQEDMLLARFRAVAPGKRNAILELLKPGK